jgi:hypothetical protein
MKIKKITSMKTKKNTIHKKTKSIKLSNNRDYDKYTNYVNKIIKTDKTLWTFKSSGLYTEILEHIIPYHSHLYFREIKKKFHNFYNKYKSFLIKLCDKNDLYGKPNKIKFTHFTTCSSTNLRYILHSLLILTFMKKHNLNNIDIIEIGGGYGGLSFFLHHISPIFNIKINSYTIFDLLNVSKLQKVYLEALNSAQNMNFYQINNYKELKPNSFLIANYSYSEIAMNLQKEYTEKILNPYVSYGFLVWNFIPIYDFIDNKIISSELEVPDTSGHKTNYYITFIPK